MHMAIGAVVNALWDLRAKRAGLPLWELLAAHDARRARRPRRLPLPDRRHDPRSRRSRSSARAEPGRAARREDLLRRGYPAYTTTPGWLGYDDEKMARLCREAVAEGFTQIKLKVGADLDGRHPPAAGRAGRGRAGHPHRDRRQPALGCRRRGQLDHRAGALRSVLGGGAHQPRRHPGTCHDPPRRSRRSGSRPANMCQNRMIFKQMLQAGSLDVLQIDAAPGGRRQREHRDPAAGRDVRRSGVPACRRRRTVRAGAAPVDVRLVAVSGTTDDRRSNTSTTCTSTS